MITLKRVTARSFPLVSADRLHFCRGPPAAYLPRQQHVYRNQAPALYSRVAKKHVTCSATGQPDVQSAITAVSNYFPVFVLLFAALGVAQPSTMTWVPSSVVTWAIGLSMLGMGLTLTLEDFKRVLSAPKQILIGVVLQYTVMPSLAFIISRMAQLPLDWTIGLCIVGACPGGTASNIVTYLAKADVPLSVAMTTASTLGAVFMTPLLTSLLLGTLVQVDGVGLLVSTLQVVLLPVLLGCALNQAFPKAVSKVTPLSTLSAVFLVAFICGRVMAENSAAMVTVGVSLFFSVFALHAGGFALGYGVSKYLLGIPEKSARTNSIEVGMQNSALGAMLARTHFAAACAVPCAVSACLHSTIGSILAWFWRSRSDDTTAQVQ
jgi:BASS family bile acid:Na+ symporter